MKLDEILQQASNAWSVVRHDRTFGDDQSIHEQIYRIRGVSGLDAALTVLDYGVHPPGRVVKTVEVWPDHFQGKGYAQALYLAALRDGPLQERPEFRSGESARAVERLVSKHLAVRDAGTLSLAESDSPYDLHLFHGTDAVFDRFAPYSHFGTEAQARMRHSKRILPVTVTARKFKRLRDTGAWDKAKLRSLERQGFEGVVYLNRYEGIPLAQFEAAYEKMSADKLDRLSDSQYKRLIPAAEDSYIVFDPYAVKLAL